MCHECWKEFKGWCRSFTRTEAALTILEGVLLIACIAFLAFLIIHLIVCEDNFTNNTKDSNTNWQGPDSKGHPQETTCATNTRLPDRVVCTWRPFNKTEATHYYYYLSAKASSPTTPMSTTAAAGPATVVVSGLRPPNGPLAIDDLVIDEQSDGEESEDDYKQAVLALVKPTPPQGVTFGCTLTVLTSHWTVTAASCIEAIEEVDSLDNFVMMEGYGGARGGRTYAVADVQVHPLYRGAAPSYELAALRCDPPLPGAARAPRLPAPRDYYLLTPGERLTILGFGPFRTLETGAARGLRSVHVYALPAAQCAGEGGEGEGEGWAPRHLSRGQARTQGACGSARLCAGVRHARGSPCNYCAGTPLLRARTLLGVMAGRRQCAVACEPAEYVNVALLRDWLDLVLDTY